MGIISLSLSFIGFILMLPAVTTVNLTLAFFAIVFEIAAVVTGIIAINIKSYRALGIVGLILGSIVCLLSLLYILVPVAIFIHVFIKLLVALSS